MSIRPIKRVVEAQPTIEGAGVQLRRAFGFGATDDFDPRVGVEKTRHFFENAIHLPLLTGDHREP